MQERRKEVKIGPTIWKEPQSDNYWSDLNTDKHKALTTNDKIFGPTKVGVVGPAPPALICKKEWQNITLRMFR